MLTISPEYEELDHCEGAYAKAMRERVYAEQILVLRLIPRSCLRTVTLNKPDAGARYHLASMVSALPYVVPNVRLAVGLGADRRSSPEIIKGRSMSPIGYDHL